MKLLSLIALLAALATVNSLNILAIFPYQGKSHFIVYRVLLRELVDRGHSVTVISHFPEEKPLKNYNDISLAGTIPIQADNMPIERSYKIILGVISYLHSSGNQNCEVMLANKEVQDILKKKTKFDLVLTEQFNSDCSLAIAYKLGAPVVGIASSVLMPWQYRRHGIPYNPSYVPFHFLEGGTKPSLYQRVERVLFHTYCELTYYFQQKHDEKTIAQYFDDVPPLEDLAREVKLLLTYYNFVLTGSRLFPASIVEVAGFHVEKPKPLTGELKKFVEEAEHGVIYISFGSVVVPSSLSKEKLDAVLEAMNQLPQRFIWRWTDKSLPVDKNKLYISDWLPQVDILGHPKTVAFFTHAGMGSTLESILNGVPMVAMPVVGDQPSNAAAIAESGFGVELQIWDLNKESLVAALKKVMAPEFKENVKKLSKAFHDRPVSPMDTAIFWIEFAATHPNVTFRAPSADVPLYQYLNLDVACVFTMIFLIIFSVIKMILSMFLVKKSKSKRE